MDLIILNENCSDEVEVIGECEFICNYNDEIDIYVDNYNLENITLINEEFK